MMNVYTLFFVALLLAFCLPSQAQEIDIREGEWYMQSGEAKRFSDISTTLKTVPLAAYYVRRRTLNTVLAFGTIAYGLGTVAILPLVVAEVQLFSLLLGAKAPSFETLYWQAFAYVAPFALSITTIAAILLFKGASQNAHRAVEAYNASLDISSRQKSPIEFKLNVGVNSVGLAMVF